METRSKTRVGQALEPDPESARGTPETPVLRASSESSFDLTVLMDEGEAGVVGPGRPSVRATTTSTMTTLADQPRDAAGVDPVREPTHDFGSPSDDTVTEHHRQEPTNPTIVIFSCKLLLLLLLLQKFSRTTLPNIFSDIPPTICRFVFPKIHIFPSPYNFPSLCPCQFSVIVYWLFALFGLF